MRICSISRYFVRCKYNDFHGIRRKSDKNFTESVAKSTGISQNPSRNRQEFHIIRREIDKKFTESVAKSTEISQNPLLGKCILAQKKKRISSEHKQEEHLFISKEIRIFVL